MEIRSALPHGVKCGEPTRLVGYGDQTGSIEDDPRAMSTPAKDIGETPFHLSTPKQDSEGNFLGSPFRRLHPSHHHCKSLPVSRARPHVKMAVLIPKSPPSTEKLEKRVQLQS